MIAPSSPLPLPPLNPDQLVLAAGFSDAALGSILGVSSRAVAYRRKRALAAGVQPLDMGIMTSEVALALAQRRGGAQMPFWSRLAVLDYHKRGMGREELARLFGCSPGTISDIVRHRGWRYADFTGVRHLTASQAKPPAAGWGKRRKIPATVRDTIGR